MQIIIGNHAGFCYGVQAAVNMAFEACQAGKTVWALGSLVHNDQVMRALADAGLKTVESIDDIAAGVSCEIPSGRNIEKCAPGDKGVVIVRSHGVCPETLAALSAKGLEIIDATCPNVARVHTLVGEYSADGATVILAGQAEHPEVRATAGWCRGPVIILQSAEQAHRAVLPRRAMVAAQTTLTQPVWQGIVEVLRQRVPALTVANTICAATEARQKEAVALCGTADAMIVVGGHHSANARALYDTCRAHCKRAYFIESAAELPLDALSAYDIIGLTAGASTPDWSLKEVATRMNDMEQNTPQEPAEQQVTNEPVQDNAPVQAEDAPVQVQAEPEAEQTEAAPAAEASAQIEDAPEAAEETEAAPAAEAPAQIEDAPEAAAETAPEAASMDSAESSFMADLEATLVTIRPGQTITGTVVQITDDEVCVNIGFKSDGLIKRSELVSTDVNVGDEIDVEVVKVNDGEGNVVLSQRNIVNRRNWDALMEQYDNGEYVDGVGKEAVKGGLIATVNGIRAFVPASHLSQRYVERIEDFVGKEMKLKIIEVDKQKKRIVASRKAVLQEESAARKDAIWAKLIEGDVIPGIVRRLTDFGAFVDIGGVDGLVHVTDLSWGRVRHPSDIVSPNQEIMIKILSLDPERERIQLGYKQIQPRPWDIAEEKYPAGSVVEGKVVRITTFGAFVELEPGLDGLVHISQCALTRIGKVEDAVQVGDIVRVKVLGVDPQAKRISLSIRAALEDDAFNYSDEIPGDDLMYDSAIQEEYATPVNYEQMITQETEAVPAEDCGCEVVESIPAEVPEEAPVEVAEEAPVEVAEEAPAEVPEEVPAEVAEEAPAEVVEEAPAEAAEEAKETKEDA